MEETSQKDINYPRIVPRSLTAGCCAKNKGALDWSVFFTAVMFSLFLKFCQLGVQQVFLHMAQTTVLW